MHHTPITIFFSLYKLLNSKYISMERLDRLVRKDLLVELQTLFTWIEEELPSTTSKKGQEPIAPLQQ
jgi:hypothetical protein